MSLPGRGWRNCTTCTRWRPITDFPPKGWVGERCYKIGWQCRSCKNAYARALWKRNYLMRSKVKQYRREYEASQRREKGVPVRVVGPLNKGKYGAGRVKRTDQAESKRRYRAKRAK